MGRKRFKRTGRVRPVGPLPPSSDLPSDVALFMRIFDDAGSGYTAEPSEGGTVWTIRDQTGSPMMGFASGPAAAEVGPPEGLGESCMDLTALWADPEFRRHRESGLVDIYGRPTHPEGRDFFAEHHAASGHDHG